MTTFQWAMLAAAGAGHLMTIAVLLLANARRDGRRDEATRGLGRSLDQLRHDNEQDHKRYDRHLESWHATRPGA